MRNLILAGLAALLLAGCEPAEDQRARVNSQLPTGCRLKELGKLGGIDNLVLIICEGQRTTATLNYTESHQSGKTRTTKQMVVFQVGDLQ